MNLLFLTPHLPYPPHQGTALRNWGLMHELVGRHTITLLTFAAPGEDAAPVRQRLHEVITAPLPRRTPLARLGQQLSPRPDLSYRLASRGFDAALRQLLERRSFDAVQIEGLEMARALPLVRETAPRARLVYDAHNVEYLLQRSAFLADLRWPPRWPAALYSLLQWPRLRRFEAGVCRAADVVACVSREDAAALRGIAPGVQPVVVPNGLRLADYPYSPDRRPGPELVQAGVRGEHPLAFTGKLDYRPNVDAADWFVRAILPQVQAALPDVQFLMVGRDPHPRLLALAAHAGVLLAGDVPDIRPDIAGAAAYVMPLRMGSGTPSCGRAG
jgi:glycosyltransferase involved in cell wall biosynthesis